MNMETPHEQHDNLTVKYAASLLRVNPATIMRWHKSGDIRLLKFPRRRWRVPYSEVDRILGKTEQTELSPEA